MKYWLIAAIVVIGLVLYTIPAHLRVEELRQQNIEHMRKINQLQGENDKQMDLMLKILDNVEK